MPRANLKPGLRSQNTRPTKRRAKPKSLRIRIKRIYEPPAPQDGLRFLVDRLWPRGLKKEDCRLDGWLKELAPSAALRRWFGHDPARWQEFQAGISVSSTSGRTLARPLPSRRGKGPSPSSTPPAIRSTTMRWP